MKPIQSLLRQLMRYFLAGVFAILPLVITVAIVIWVTDFISTMVGPETALGGALKNLGLTVAADTATPYVLGWVAVLGIIFLLGVLVEFGAKRFLERGLDGALRRVPLMGSVYGTAKQLVGMLNKKKDSDIQGMSVVYCVFGRETGAMFLALLPTPERFRISGVDYHAVLIPSAPVPVGGSLIFVPADSVHPADVSIDAFMSIYVSMGVSGPQFLSKPAN
jgi:uncharacterized membrane protein